MSKTCFMCPGSAPTDDHVPPRAFYPAAKDLPEDAPDVRKNLITVPACAQHNNGQSKDDQYAASTVVTSLNNNDLSRDHIAGKVLRALRRTPHFIKTLMPNARPAVIDGEESVAFQIDGERVGSVMTRIARGLYFHHTSRKLKIPLDWISPDMIHIERGFHPGAQKLAGVFDNYNTQDPESAMYQGVSGSEQVFKYEFVTPNDLRDQRTYFRFHFYEGFRVLVLPRRTPAEAE